MAKKSNITSSRDNKSEALEDLAWQITELGENLGHLEVKCLTVACLASAATRAQAKTMAKLSNDMLSMLSHVKRDHRDTIADLAKIPRTK